MAEVILSAGVYLAIGVVFALWFVTAGVGRLDAAARGAAPLFRLFIFPGSAALWPAILILLVQARRRDD
jgi:hypothetical protein